MKLTATKVKAAKPAEKAYKLFDGRGLFLQVTPAGSKSWRLKYRIGGREKLLTFGPYPEISLADARDRTTEARRELLDGKDPSEKKRREALERQYGQATTFEAVAEEWCEKKLTNRSQTHRARCRNLLDRYLFKSIGSRPIKELSAPEVLEALRRIEARGYINSAHKARQVASQVFRYAIATGRAERDPVADLRGALQEIEKRHFSAITDPAAVGPLMSKIFRYEGSAISTTALKVSAYIPSRPGEIRTMEWSEVDLEAGVWELPENKTKTGQAVVVPLSRQVLEVLEELKKYTGSGRYVFPSARGDARPLSENTVRLALRALDYGREDMTAHGFRAMFRTIADEVLGYPVDWIEHQLGHSVRDANGRAYNRTKHLDRRRELMQAWADYLDHLRELHEEGETISSATGKEFAFG
ncbi:tyrosine-type recombinase/integrase [Parahaliea mediterranea]|uniref:tyrosine-type recombinase/integrase n=1 Tax=Parahaliea mediterranea TaxID=651086 RepID=UPI000E2EF975|nr:integrase arm-type DNA-binding domain-containing protein [Parahaliea mediterranea]